MKVHFNFTIEHSALPGPAGEECVVGEHVVERPLQTVLDSSRSQVQLVEDDGEVIVSMHCVGLENETNAISSEKKFSIVVLTLNQRQFKANI